MVRSGCGQHPRRCAGWFRPCGKHLAVDLFASQSDVDGAIKPLLYGDLIFLANSDGLVFGKLVELFVVLDGEVVLDDSAVVTREDAVELRAFFSGKGAVQVGLSSRGHPKPLVEPGDECFLKELVCACHVADASQTHLFDEPILQGVEQTFHPALGLRAVGEDWLNGQ